MVGRLGPLSRAALPAWLAATGAYAFVLAFSRIRADDVWWHLASGRLMVESRSLLYADPFSYTFPGAPWTDFEWLYQLALYGAHAAAGYTGVILFRTALVGLAALLLLLATDRLTGGRHRFLAGVTVWLFLAGAWLRMADRPHLVSLAMLGLHLLVYAVAVRDDRRRWAILLLPAAQIVWVNCHSEWPLGPLFVGLMLVEALAARRRQAAGRLAVALPLSAGAAFANPYGPAIIGSITVHRTGSAALASIHEWVDLPAFIVRFSDEYLAPVVVVTGLLAAICLLLLLAAIRRRRVPPALTGLFLILLVATVRHWRFAPEALLAGMPLAAVILSGLRPPPRFRLGPPLAGAGLLLLLGLLPVYGQTALPFYRFGSGILPQHQPAAAARFLREEEVGGRLYARFTPLSGFMLWQLYPRARVFWDGRIPTLYPPEFVARYGTLDPAVFDSATGRYGTDLVVLSGWRTHRGDNTLAGWLLRHPDWRLIYFDREAIVFMHRLHPEAEAWTGRWYRELDPLEPPRDCRGVLDRGPKRLAGLLAEVARNVADSRSRFAVPIAGMVEKCTAGALGPEASDPVRAALEQLPVEAAE